MTATGRARDTEPIRRLDAEWTETADAPWFRHHLAGWAVSDVRLAFEDGHQLLAAAQRRTPGDWTRRDAVLSALLDLYPTDETARRVALQVVLPGVKHLIDGLGCWDVEERAARVVAMAVDSLAQAASDPAGTPPNFRVFVNTRRKAIREAVRSRANPETTVEDITSLIDRTQDEWAPEGDVDELVAWLTATGRVGEETARLVVLTRTAGVAVPELAAASGVAASTIRQRRLRAEQRLRQSQGLGR